jgi:AcrR family transcriptional regulator
MPRAGLSAASLVESAAALADAGGYESLSLTTLADSVGVRPPSLYKHIASLDDLRSRLALHAYREIGRLLREALDGPGDSLANLSAAYRRFALERPGLAVALVRAPVGDGELALAAAQVTEPLFALVREYGINDPDELVHEVRILRSALHGFVSLEAAGGFGLAQSLDATFERLIAALDVGLKAAASAA